MNALTNIYKNCPNKMNNSYPVNQMRKKTLKTCFNFVLVGAYLWFLFKFFSFAFINIEHQEIT